jgi:hypothetical protein
MSSNIEDNENQNNDILYVVSVIVATILSSLTIIFKKDNIIQVKEEILPEIKYEEIDTRMAAIHAQDLQDENDMLHDFISTKLEIIEEPKVEIQKEALDFLIIECLKSNQNGLSVNDIYKRLVLENKGVTTKNINSRLFTMINKKKTKIVRYEGKTGKRPIWTAL